MIKMLEVFHKAMRRTNNHKLSGQKKSESLQSSEKKNEIKDTSVNYCNLNDRNLSPFCKAKSKTFGKVENVMKTLF